MRSIGRNAVVLAALLFAACSGGGGGGGLGDTEEGPPPEPPPLPLDGTATDIPLVHGALVYDSTRNLYYASVRGSAPSNGNRIATIDPSTGQVAYSAPVGADPNALALSGDATLLYVGLDGSGDVVKLALPSMTEQARTKLLSGLNALSIAVSPADATVIAVALARTGVSPSYAGLVLLRDMAIQPRQGETFLINNLIAFDAAGTSLYGLNTQSSEFALRRMDVVADGFPTNPQVTKAAIGHEVRTLSVIGSRIIAGGAFYDAPALSAQGVVSTPSDCVQRRAGDLLVCFDDVPHVGESFLLLADPATFVIKAGLRYAEETGAPRSLLEGPAGQMAISYPGTKVRLFASADLLTPPTPPVPSWPVATSTTADGQTLDIGIVHNALAYDSVRNVYYASIPGAVTGVGNSIATINPANGQVTHSAPVGSEPGELALAADASVLYVGLDGSGEVLRLALPAMTPQGRTRLRVAPFDGITHAESIAVSPADPTVAAVSMAFDNLFPHHAGVVLLRDMVVQPKALPEGQDGNNLLAFDSAASKLYGLTIEVIDFGIHRTGVLADGLAEEQRVNGAASVFTRAMAFANGRAIAGATLFDTPALTAAGSIAGASDCWPARTGTALLCFSSQAGRAIVADSTTFAAGPSLVYTDSEPDRPQRLVQGPAGQIGISYFPDIALPFVRLFTSSQLP